MKRFFCAVLALILSVSLCGCASLHAMLEAQLEPADTVVLFPSASLPEFSHIDEDLLKNANEELRYRSVPTDTPAAQYAAFAAAAAAPDTAVLVAELSSTVYAAAMIETAEEYDLPLIFCGKRPPLSAMEQYDNCWYVGFDPALAAELQAQIVTDAYRADTVTDQSGDFKLSALVTGIRRVLSLHTENYAEKLLHAVELAGAHTASAAEPVFAQDTEALYHKLDELLLPQKQQVIPEQDPQETGSTFELLAPAAQTELIFCADTEASAAVLQLLTALQNAAKDESLSAAATPERRYFISCYGIDAAVEQAVADGIFLGAVGLDPTACTQAIRALCANLARKEAINKNNTYYFEDGKYLMLDYRVITAPTEAAP